MGARIFVALLSVGVLSTVMGCYVDPYGPSYDGYGYYGDESRYGTSQGVYRAYDRDEEKWRAYRRHRRQQGSWDPPPAPPVDPSPGVPSLPSEGMPPPPPAEMPPPPPQ